MSEPEFSDVDSNGFNDEFLGDISCDDYSEGNSGDEEVEIDMDSSPIKTTLSRTPAKTTTKTATKPAIINIATAPALALASEKSKIAKKPIVKKAITTTSSIDSRIDSRIEIDNKNESSKTKPISKAVKDLKKDASKSVKEPQKESGKESIKESAADSKFQFNEETIEYFCKDILGDVKKICVPNSSFNNDTALLCLLLKLQIIKEYKCIEKKCKTGKTWLGNPIQLLIHRKNGKMHDLSITNLELICANCYIAKYGLDLFVKVISKTIYTCTYCNYPLSNFTNSKKKERICMSCESKIMTSGYFEQRSKFIDQLSDTIDEASTLKKDEFKSSNYYSQVSQFKSFDSSDSGGFKSSRNKAPSEISRKTFNDKPIIQLNLTVPNLDDLISED